MQTRGLKLKLTVVSDSEASVNALCSSLRDKLDYAHPPGLTPLIPNTDSGSYPSDLIDSSTGMAYAMRVLSHTTTYQQ